MEELVIRTEWWQVFIALFSFGGMLIGAAWVMSGRISTIEADIKWLVETVADLKGEARVSKDNDRVGIFVNNSPVMLTQKGEELIENSGIKAYIDENKDAFLSGCLEKSRHTAYEIQEYIFDLFDRYEFPSDVEKTIQDKAYKEGIGTETIRRAGAIYFRGICLDEFGKDLNEIDQTNPN